LICWLLQDTRRRLDVSQEKGEDKFTARNNAQVFRARVLSLAYAEVRNYDLWFYGTVAQVYKEGSVGTCTEVITGDLFGRIMLQNNSLMYFWRRCNSENLDSAVRMVLVKLYTLYGLWCLEKHLSLFYQGKVLYLIDSAIHL
jgi:acyl-CoA oxidase